MISRRGRRDAQTAHAAATARRPPRHRTLLCCGGVAAPRDGRAARSPHAHDAAATARDEPRAGGGDRRGAALQPHHSLNCECAGEPHASRLRAAWASSSIVSPLCLSGRRRRRRRRRQHRHRRRRASEHAARLLALRLLHTAVSGGARCCRPRALPSRLRPSMRRADARRRRRVCEGSAVLAPSGRRWRQILKDDSADEGGGGVRAASRRRAARAHA